MSCKNCSICFTFNPFLLFRLRIFFVDLILIYYFILCHLIIIILIDLKTYLFIIYSFKFLEWVLLPQPELITSTFQKTTTPKKYLPKNPIFVKTNPSKLLKAKESEVEKLDIKLPFMSGAKAAKTWSPKVSDSTPSKLGSVISTPLKSINSEWNALNAFRNLLYAQTLKTAITFMFRVQKEFSKPKTVLI